MARHAAGKLRQGSGLVHRSPSPVTDDVELVVLDLPMEQLQPGFGHHLRAALPDCRSIPLASYSGFNCTGRRISGPLHEATFLSADPNGDRVTLFRTEAGGMGTFLPVSPVDLDVLRAILTSSWLIRSSGVLADDLARVAVLPFQPSDRPRYMAARYFILDSPDARQFQPLLYVDTGTVFDSDVAPMLRAVAMSDRIAAPMELLSPLAANPALGATLQRISVCRATWPGSIPARSVFPISARTPRRCD